MPSSDARATVARLKQIFTSGTCRWCRLSVTQFPRIAQPYRLDQVRNRGNGPMLFMMTSSNGNIFRVTGHLCGEFTPRQRPMTRSFDAFFVLCLIQRLSKQSWGWWFETLPRPLWRHRNEKRFDIVVGVWASGSTAFIWKLRFHWPISLQDGDLGANVRTPLFLNFAHGCLFVWCPMDCYKICNNTMGPAVIQIHFIWSYNLFTGKANEIRLDFIRIVYVLQMYSSQSKGGSRIWN